MNQATKPWQDSIDNGWSVQIYSRDRRLICSLYPSHGWAFGAGLLIGCLITLLIAQVQVQAPSSSPDPLDPSVSSSSEALLHLD